MLDLTLPLALKEGQIAGNDFFLKKKDSFVHYLLFATYGQLCSFCAAM